MSKISITPNASGTGVFTIASPATSTDRTLTLPDEAGTVLTSASSLASANLTGAVTVSGSNVGIGVVPDAANGSYLQFANGYFTGQNGFGRNTYFDGSNYKAIYTGGATIIQGGDDFLFYTAASVSADANQTFVERMRIDSSGVLFVNGLYTNTTAGGANVYVSGLGSLYRSTSSLRYKNTVTAATHGLTELMSLRPVTYKGNNDGDTVFGGLIAEEVHDAGLTEFVTYNDEGQPDALAYSNMVSLCIKAIQEQQATITAQQTTIEAMETRLAALEAV